MKPFRDVAPVRTYSGHKDNYGDYKPFLAEDFHHKCGYTHCSDVWFGGQRCFHIDHRIPWKKHTADNPSLKTDYSNLVYSCSYVNIQKSDDESPNYLDPCDTDYNKHFHRDDLGNIIPDTAEAKYMYSHMKLGMSRYAIVWMLDQLQERIDKLLELNERVSNQEIKDLIVDFTAEYRKYEKYLVKNQ